MAIRKIGSQESIALDQPNQSNSNKIRKVDPSEVVVLDQNKRAPSADFMTSLSSGAAGAAEGLFQSVSGITEAGGQAVRSVIPENLRPNLPREYAPSVSAQAISDDLDIKKQEINFTPTNTAAEVFESPSAFLTRAPRAIIENVPASLPYLAASLAGPAGVAANLLSISGSVAEDRAEAKGEVSPSSETVIESIPFGVASAALDRFGALRLINPATGNLITKPLKSGLSEFGTEAIQSSIEQSGSLIGTDKEFDAVEMAQEAGLEGLVGFGVGGATRAAGEVTGLIKSAPEILEDSVSEQSLGSDEGQTRIPPVVQEIEINLPPNRENLIDAIENDTPIPDSRPVSLPVVDIDPLLQDQGYIQGADIEQTNNETNDVFAGKLVDAQLVDGDLEVTVMDDNGELKTLFASDGDILTQQTPDMPVEQQLIDPQEQISIPDNQQSGLESETLTPKVPDQSKRPDSLTPQPQNEFENMDADRLANVLASVKGQAKSSGWDKRLMGIRDQIQNELETRFPERASRTLEGITQINEPVGDSVLANSYLLGNQTNTQATVPKKFNSLKRDIKHMILSEVVTAINDDQVFNSIVESVPVNVMNMLIGVESSSNSLFHDKSVFTKSLAIPSDKPIPVSIGRFIDALPVSFKQRLASRIAEKSSLSLSGAEISGKDRATVGANELSVNPIGISAQNRTEELSLPDSGSFRGETGVTSITKDGRHIKTDIVGEKIIQVDIKPTENQKQAGNYLHGSVSIQGLPISIENVKGSQRTGTDANGQQWSVDMPAHYGYIKRTVGADNEQIDVYVGDDPSSDLVVIIDQVDADNEFFEFDEHKVMLGYNDVPSAVEAYKNGFSDGKGENRMGGVTPMRIKDFKEWLKQTNKSKKKPVAYKKLKPVREDVKESPPTSTETLAANNPDQESNLNTQETESSLSDAPVMGTLGMKLGEGDVVLTTTGRQTTPFPRIGIGTPRKITLTVSRIQKWLVSNAADEAQARGDDFNFRTFNAEKDRKNIPQATLDSAEYYLFDPEFLFQNPQSLFPEANAQRLDTEGKTQDDKKTDVSSTEQPTSSTGSASKQSEPADQGSNVQNENQEAAGQSSVDKGSNVTQDQPQQQEGGADDTGVEDAGAEPQAQKQEADASPVVDQITDVSKKVSRKESDKSVKEKQNTEKIEDFGEKLEGARKDTWESYNNSLTSKLPDDYSEITMSKHFPEPNYEQLIEDGMDVERLATFKAIRDEVKNKPRQRYKLARWVDDVKQLRDMAHSIINDQKSFEKFKSEGEKVRQLGGFFDRIQLYKDLGYPAFTKAKDWKIRESSGVIENGVKLDRPVWFVSKKNSWGTRFDSYEKALQGLKAELANASTGKKKTKLDVYQIRATKEVFVGKKVASGKFIDLKGGFETSRDAHKYLRENYDDLVALLEKKKNIAPLRRAINEPRIGEDYREGKDVSSEQFSETFGFRGVQFGNYVEQSKRIEDLNNAFDGLTDMAKIIGVPERALSLNGKLGLAFGARGKGAAAGIVAKAHYEPDHVVINLTKKSGAGSLGHEWWHSLDHYFGKMNEGKFITDKPYSRKYTADGKRDVLPVRQEVVDAYNDVVKAITKDTKIEERSKKLDQLRSKDYYSTIVEMTARAFEGYLIHKADQNGGRNDYLANIDSQKSFEAIMGDGTYPYPIESEIDTIVQAYDKLFETIETREDGDNIAMFSLADRTVNGLQSQLLNAAREMNQNKGTGAQMLAMLRKSSGVKDEEIAWTGLDDFIRNRGGVTKEEIVQYLEENQVQIEEVTLGGYRTFGREEALRNFESGESMVAVFDDGTESMIEDIEDITDHPDRQVFALDEEYGQADDSTKYSDYTMPGGQNYREVLLTLDVKKPEGRTALQIAQSMGYDVKSIYDLPDADLQKVNAEYQKGVDSGIDREKNKYKSSHFNQPNILAHVRLNDRTTADGKKVLFVEEIQSDWHQAGRKKGYKSPSVDSEFSAARSRADQIKDRLDIVRSYLWDMRDEPQTNQTKKNLIAEKDDLQAEQKEVESKLSELNKEIKYVPDAPFKKNWHEMAFRRVAQMAAQNGYDAVAWTPGDVQNDRFDLSKKISKVEYFGDNGAELLRAYDMNGNQVINQTRIKPENLEDYVGKDVAERLMKSEPDKYGVRQMSGLDLKVGGKGMKGFYDKILKNYADKFGKKYGSKVEVTKISSEITEKIDGENVSFDANRDVWSLPVTDKMRDAANAGFALFRKTDEPIKSKFVAKMEDAINSRLKALGWPQANFKSYTSINELPDLTGLDDGVQGFYWRKMVYVSMNAKNILETIDHEVIHGLKDFGAFTPSEWAALERKAPQWRKKYKIDKNYTKLMQQQGVKTKLGLERRLNEEAIAHAFQDRSNKGIVQRIVNKVIKFFKTIKQVLTGRPYNFSDAEQVFRAVESGQIGSRLQQETISDTEDFPKYQLGKRRRPALKQAQESLARVTGLDSSFTSDIRRINATILHPQQIAVLHKPFVGVYRAVIERFKQREVLIHDLSKNIAGYSKLKDESKTKVHAALEIGRLSGKTFDPNKNGVIIVQNDGYKNAVHSKDGETITLTPTETAGYLGVRKSMNDAHDKAIEIVLEQYGLVEKGAKSIQDVEKMRLEASKNKMVAEVKFYKEVLQRLNDVADSKKRGYVPFKRWGQIGVSVKNQDNDVIHFERVQLPGRWKRKGKISETKEVQDAIERLESQYNEKGITINVFEVPKFFDDPASLDLKEYDVLLANSKVSEKEKSNIRDVLRLEMNKRGFSAHFIKAKDTPGYSDDFERAINDYIVSFSSYASKVLNKRKIDEEVSSVAAGGHKDLHDYSQKYVSYIDDLVEEFSTIRMIGFTWYIAGSVGSGLVNATQPYLVTAPWLKGKFSHAQIAGSMAKANRDALKMIDPKQDYFDFFNFEKAPLDIREALKKAYAEGDFLSMATHDAMAISNSTTQSLRGLDKAKRTTAEIIGLTFSVPEKTNRVVTFISAYRLALDPDAQKKIKIWAKNNEFAQSMLKDKTGEDFAFAYAELAVVSTQFRMGKLNRPQLARGYGTLVFQFLSFTMQSMELMYNLGKVQGGQSKQSLAMILFALAAVAGLKGLPFEDDFQETFELIYKYATGIDLDIDSKVREALIAQTGSKFMAETIMKGLPSSTLNVDLSNRLGFGNVVPDTELDFLGVWHDLLIGRSTRAAEYAKQGDFNKVAAEILPKFAGDMLTAYSWSSDGVRTRRGAKVLDKDELENSDKILKFLGITSANISRKRDEVWSTTRANRAVDDLRSRYYSRMAKALAERKRRFEEGDEEGVQEMSGLISAIIEEINRHNQTAPIHQRIILNRQTVKRRFFEELSGSDAKRVRKQAQPRAQELKEIYDW